MVLTWLGAVFFPFPYCKVAVRLMIRAAPHPLWNIPEFKYGAVADRRGDKPVLKGGYGVGQEAG